MNDELQTKMKLTRAKITRDSSSTIGRVLPLYLLLLGVAFLHPATKPAEARSILDVIPGTNVVVDIARELAEKMSKTLDNNIIAPISSKIETEMTVSADCARDPDANRTVADIIRSRGFEAEEHDVVTRDGYILTIQRIINPLIDSDLRKTLKPVILQHGLMSSSVDWVINSMHVKPKKYPREPIPPAADASKQAPRYANDDDNDNKESNVADNTIEGHRQVRLEGGEQSKTNLPECNLEADSQEHPNALGFYLANEGYDVFLANSRGNKYGQRHVKLSSWNPKFWDFTFDEQIKYDLPDTTSYIQTLTGSTKVGYVGHSQGTAMMFGLLSDQPDYADVYEPVVMLAPVAYVSNTISPIKYFAIYTPIFEHVNMWFGSSNIAVSYLMPIVCKPQFIKNEICANLVFLTTGFDPDQLDLSRVSAYTAHMPSGTSVKNIAHYGQEVLSGRFAHFDHGILGNQAVYGRTRAPDYDLTKIRSKSLVLFTSENDWLASPKDVAKLRADLHVSIFREHNITIDNAKWNHIDFVYGKDCGVLVNKRIVDAFHFFDL